MGLVPLPGSTLNVGKSEVLVDDAKIDTAEP